jgi:hypothetical protein
MGGVFPQFFRIPLALSRGLPYSIFVGLPYTTREGETMFYVLTPMVGGTEFANGRFICRSRHTDKSVALKAALNFGTGFIVSDEQIAKGRNDVFKREAEAVAVRSWNY